MATLYTTNGTTTSLFGDGGADQVFLSDVGCAGLESGLLECYHSVVDVGTLCTHDRDVGLRCECKFSNRKYCVVYSNHLSIMN